MNPRYEPLEIKSKPFFSSKSRFLEVVYIYINSFSLPIRFLSVFYVYFLLVCVDAELHRAIIIFTDRASIDEELYFGH